DRYELAIGVRDQKQVEGFLDTADKDRRELLDRVAADLPCLYELLEHSTEYVRTSDARFVDPHYCTKLADELRCLGKWARLAQIHGDEATARQVVKVWTRDDAAPVNSAGGWRPSADSLLAIA